MPDGDMRRPPRLWEQRLQQMVQVQGTGVSSAASVVSSVPAPGPGGGDSEPDAPPVLDEDVLSPRVPSTPVVSSSTLGLVVAWDGNDSGADPYPVGTSVQVHVSGATGFTPSSATLKGVITEAGGSLLVGSLTAGSASYVRFVAVSPDGVESDPSAEGSASVGLIQGPEIAGDAVITQIVSATTPATTFAEGSIWLNTSTGTYYTLTGGSWVLRQWDTAAIAASAITANQIAAQAITSKFLTGEIIRTGSSPSARVEISAANGIEVFRDATNKTFWAKPTGEVVFGTASVSAAGATVINGSSITTGSISGDRITGGTIQGSTIVTRGDGYRARLKDGGEGGVDHLEFLNGTTVLATIGATPLNFQISVPTDMAIYNNGGGLGNLTVGDVGCNEVDTSVLRAGTIGANRGLRVGSGGAVYSYGIDGNTTANAANVRVGGSAQLLKSTSTVRVKDDLQPLHGVLQGVGPEKISDGMPSVSYWDVLDVCPTEFRSLAEADDGQRVLGFIAEDVAEKFPWAAEWDPDGVPSAVNDRPIIAALLAVVREQGDRIAALESQLM